MERVGAELPSSAAGQRSGGDRGEVGDARAVGEAAGELDVVGPGDGGVDDRHAVAGVGRVGGDVEEGLHQVADAGAAVVDVQVDVRRAGAGNGHDLDVDLVAPRAGRLDLCDAAAAAALRRGRGEDSRGGQVLQREGRGDRVGVGNPEDVGTGAAVEEVGPDRVVQRHSRAARPAARLGEGAVQVRELLERGDERGNGRPDVIGSGKRSNSLPWDVVTALLKRAEGLIDVGPGPWIAIRCRHRFPT